MALAEDPASVLDAFVSDAANLPAEVAHLLEEIQAKDKQVQECRNNINTRDNSLQKHVKANGGHVKHPKEEQLLKSVYQSYDTAQALQDEKLALSEKAKALLDRHVKRLDLKLRELQNEGSMLEDTQLPSLLHNSPANLVDPDSGASTGVNTPLGFQGHQSTNIANAAMARMAATNAAQANRALNPSSVAGMQPHPLMTGSSMSQKHREMSAGANDPKRRRLNATLGTLPNPTSSLARAASLGPGTPKPGTPGSRAGSVGPRTKKAGTKKVAPHQQQSQQQLQQQQQQQQQTKTSKKSSKNGTSKKSSKKVQTGGRATPSTTGDDNSEGTGSDFDNASSTHGNDGAEDEDAEDAGYDEEGEDNRLYCVCRSVSHGDMVACDNAKCRYEWFHWECVGLTSEPKGKWLCPNCKKLPPNQIKMAR